MASSKTDLTPPNVPKDTKPDVDEPDKATATPPPPAPKDDAAQKAPKSRANPKAIRAGGHVLRGGRWVPEK